VSRRWSIDEIVTSLEAQAAFHRERQAFHAGHEALHQKERLRHTAELDAITERLESFRAASAAAVEVAARAPAGMVRTDRPSIADQDFGAASNPRLTRMVRHVLADLGGQEPFGPLKVLVAVQRGFGGRLRTQPDLRQISGILHRLCRTGEIQRLRRGRPHHESRYVKEKVE
jgi:hypothetical protein